MSLRPYLPEWDALALLPDVAARPPGDEYFLATVQPLQRLDDSIALLSAPLSDASGDTLDLLGDWVGEPRGGLSDAEYRRIIAGRRVVRAGGTTPWRVAAMWAALTESPTATVTAQGAGSVSMTALVPYTPSGAWLRRAGGIVMDSIALGVGVSAAIYKTTSAVYDAAPGYDIGTYAWSLPT